MFFTEFSSKSKIPGCYYLYWNIIQSSLIIYYQTLQQGNFVTKNKIATQ